MLVIDRFEGDFAVVETSNGMVNIPRADLPAHVKEGDILVIQRDASAVAKRKDSINQMMLNVFED